MCIRDRVISHELGIILDDDAQLFGTGDEIPDLLAGLAQGHRLQEMCIRDRLRVDGSGLPVDILAGMAVQIPAIIYDIAAVGIVQIRCV